jgi:bifunctional DNA-binding transcriptional regulator/antitoxin component of YhaV-PrlF toxin-antitoxin module
MLNTAQMSKLTQGLASKSEKMRILAKAGYSRGDIARYLGTSYQFVRNVLVREDARTSAAALAKVSDAPSVASERNSNRVQLGPSGQIAMPDAIIKTLGLKEGDTLIATAEDDEIRLMSIPTAVRKAQAIVRQYVPAGVSLVDELLEDRRREVEREHDE